MAQEKKSFLLYVDLIHTMEKLNDEQTGRLFKHILRYVNDLDPEPQDQFTEVVFEPIKQCLKRDLIKYEGIRERNKENANKRWNAKECDRIPPHTTASNRIPKRTKNADSDNDNDKDIYIYSFFNSLIDYGFNKNLVNDWIQVRKAKKLTNTKTAFDKFIIEVEKCKLDKNEILKTCVEKSWGGFNSNWIEEEKPVYESSDDALYRNVMAQIAKNEQILKAKKNVN